MRDVSERRAAQEQLTFQAYHDALTRLPNRWQFLERLEQALFDAATERPPRRRAVPRRRPLQARERQPRSRHRRPAARRRSPSGCSRACGPATSWPASAATSSAMLLGNLARSRRRDRGRGADHREPARAGGGRRARALRVGERRHRDLARRRRCAPATCCASRTSRCTSRRTRAAPAGSCSTRSRRRT